jgi:pimeloyl-ACP methyl ester carboxylesterase
MTNRNRNPETSLLDLAGEVAATASALRDAAGTLPGLDPGGYAFGASAPGLLGRRCAALHQEWVAALAARAAEANGQADRLDETARRLRAVATNYAGADRAVQAAARRIRADRS